MTERRRLTLMDKLNILVRQAHCPLCDGKLGSLKGLQFDHEKALVAGGADRNENIRALHTKCHATKTFGKGGTTRITTRGSDIGENARDKRIAKDIEEFRRRMLAKVPGEPRRKSGRIRSGGFDKSLSKKFNGETRRTP